jgi:hypothetical protein
MEKRRECKLGRGVVEVQAGMTHYVSAPHMLFELASRVLHSFNDEFT